MVFKLNSPFFSIIIPTFNRIDDLRKALESVFLQDFEDFEVLVVDNESDDGTDKLINSISDNRLNYYRIKNNGIIAKSRNLGIKKSRGNFIVFLDSDDYWDAKKLSYLYSAINSAPNIDFLYHDFYESFDLHNKRKYVRNISRAPYDSMIKNGNPVATSCACVRSKVLKSYSFPTDYVYVGWEDFSLWLTIAKSGYQFSFLRYPLTYLKKNENNFSTSDQIIKNLTNMRRIYEVFKDAAWIDYEFGRAHIKKNEIMIARKYLLKSMFSYPLNLSLFFRTSIQYMSTLIK